MIRKIDHVVITTEHLTTCLEFYRALGFEARESAGRWELFAGNFKINVHLKGRELEPKAMNVQPGSADLCFELSGTVEACLEKLERMGIPVELGIVTRQGAHGEMCSLYLRDPDGNLIELCSYST